MPFLAFYRLQGLFMYTNNSNIPLALAVFLATDDYDYVPNTFSATTLLKPIRQIVLAKRVENNVLDVSTLVSARMGSAIHTAIEQAWKQPHKALQALNYPQSIIDRIIINPSKEQLNKDCIPVYMEQRSYKQAQGYTISGKYDFVAEGMVQDFKSTSVFNYLNQTNKEKYQLQGSIYRWLNPEIITKDYMSIHYIFTDWSKVESLKNNNYPANRVHTQKIPLLPIDETNEYICDKLNQYTKYKDVPEQNLPLCTDKDLWRKETIYKYYKNPSSTRSTKNFNDYNEAILRYIEDGSTGLIKEVKGQVSACKYCPALTICTQKDMLIEEGSLIL